MFEALNERLTGVFDRITGRGALSEKDVAEAMREVRTALLEADVALPVVKEFIAFATERATGEEVIRSVKPADQVVKIVYDGLIEMLGGEEPVPLNTNANPPAVVLMAGLQGSGKTTTSAKLARRLSQFDRKKVMMASLDTRRPAAMEQLATLGKQIEVATLPIVQGDDVLSVLPGTMGEEQLSRRLGDTEAGVIMKVGRNLPKIRRALSNAGRLGEAVYVERGTTPSGKSMRLSEKLDDTAPYFSLVLVPGWSGRP